MEPTIVFHHPDSEQYEHAGRPLPTAEDDLLREGLASTLARHGRPLPPASGESIKDWSTLVTWTDGPIEFAGVVSQVVDHDDGALAQLHQFLQYAENRLWDRHDNSRAHAFAEARERLEKIGDDLAHVVAEMLAPPSTPRRGALARSSRLPVPMDAVDRADESRTAPAQVGWPPPRPSR
ncbi:hypothetical protein GCM10010430_60490 [Kitasatospora cystarginea]|uniref:Uncharacterized protein n=1 Tax=Kitasatospora cystarginea TaxID=58350 RepID=A0ABP5RMB0_9ACTN